MAERSSPAVAALVRTSCTFPDTTARTDTTGDVPALDAEMEDSTSRFSGSFLPPPRPPHLWSPG